MSESLKLWDCPTCGFTFDADHQDIDPVTGEGNGNHTCPLCELAEKDEIITSLQEQLREANESAAHWACKHHADANRFQTQNRELAEKDRMVTLLAEENAAYDQEIAQMNQLIADYEAEALKRGDSNAVQKD
ncbi:DUF1677 domain-containing protein [Paenibacillus bouchesdurhonensis]|uniref:DUF1677 domain-containing protein n=1 Tax=Paenibacillus bouchesdurhonensis TaxID=1870990 RepID=UPI000DA5F90D|nr:DUF1677 domain-containing protein [Paenibacillus bouchesdurhonensis]